MVDLELYRLGLSPYRPVWEAMSRFTDTRDGASADQLWLVQHEPVFTQGRAGKPEHLLLPGDIPVVASDRGGQVTYHGPGQIVLYPLLDVRRLGVGVRELVSLLEQSVIDLLAVHGISAQARADAPGVYVGARKIASLGLRIRRGCSFHGVALNVDMDLTPFSRINPCGYAGLEMTQLRDLGVAAPDLDAEAIRLAGCFAARLGATLVERAGRPAALTSDAVA
ncbi:lipoyl(octanoyl) transferase LipB [Salinicola endophyticus]|uniref:Octanoyltransferase n=1 Tax=Salinicola endophyticus TaxID=1949083 RepID=A0ABY8FQU2_9GAMM|nr:lipoyl(octanoyl) transferase LipB [Salinicola endophyticus]WFF43136.1 lipoyl(octanoyl) transferase LipB [Salinicola endophyticus]